MVRRAASAWLAFGFPWAMSWIRSDGYGTTFLAAEAVGPTWTEIVTRACAHRDAHLVKYTLACIDAAHADPGAARLFQAGAASLLAHWEAVSRLA